MPEPQRPSVLATTAKAALGVAVVCLVGAHWLASGSAGRLEWRERLAAAGLFDPATTGSLRQGATVKVDPCAAPARP